MWKEALLFLLFLGMQTDYKVFVFFQNGTAEQKTNIIKLRKGPCNETHFQWKSMTEINC
jgi:hypothetical protein